jgi:hypothetical protein
MGVEFWSVMFQNEEIGTLQRNSHKTMRKHGSPKIITTDKLASYCADLDVDPSIFADKDGEFCGFVVRTSNKGPDNGKRPENAKQITDQMHSRGWGAKFIGMKVAGDDDLFDPCFEHLTRRIKRRSRLLLSSVEIEGLLLIMVKTTNSVRPIQLRYLQGH